MAIDANKLKKRAATKKTKGSPPAPSNTKSNLKKQSSGSNVLLQFKVRPETRREFRIWAAEVDLDLSQLFMESWNLYKDTHG